MILQVEKIEEMHVPIDFAHTYAVTLTEWLVSAKNSKRLAVAMELGWVFLTQDSPHLFEDLLEIWVYREGVFTDDASSDWPTALWFLIKLKTNGQSYRVKCAPFDDQ